MKTFIFVLILLSIYLNGCTQQPVKSLKMEKYNKLSQEEEYVILRKGTERPFTGKYDDFYEAGTYICRQCSSPLYNSDSKFKSGCGWPSFDDEIAGAVKRVPDSDGRRTEIICANCEGHLGHVFIGEGLTEKNVRHCVNSISMDFIPANSEKSEPDSAYFAGGCFWGVEYYMKKHPGVISTEVGYTGGTKDSPTYEDVCSHTTGHAEVVKVVFDKTKTSFESVAKLFFEIHDPTQVDRQGPDIGDQYRSEIFYQSPVQKASAEKLIKILEAKGLKVATKLTPATKYWKAEGYHQDYYFHKGTVPYCHGYTKRF